MRFGGLNLEASAGDALISNNNYVENIIKVTRWELA
jgi:hypothetical protein